MNLVIAGIVSLAWDRSTCREPSHSRALVSPSPMPLSSSSSAQSVHSPGLSEPLSPNDSNQSGVSAANGHTAGSVSVLTHLSRSSPVDPRLKTTMSSRASTPSSIIDPGDEKDNYSSDEEYFKPYKRLRMQESSGEKEPKVLTVRPSATESRQLETAADEENGSDKPLTSFLIKDILSHKPKHCTNIINSENRGIVRPWDLDTSQHNTLHHHNHHINNHHINSFGRIAPNRRPRSADDDSRSERSESDSSESPASNSAAGALTSPLDALFEMTTKAFDGIDGSEKSSGKSCFASAL